MFYLKDGTKKLFIEDNNVFTTCPICGKERKVNLADAVTDGVLDLYGTSFLCKSCGKKAREGTKDELLSL